jgi:hypothetical protein
MSINLVSTSTEPEEARSPATQAIGPQPIKNFRLKESKLGQALRHLPSGDEHANRVWLTAALLALNLTAFCCDLCPAAGASGKAPDIAPLRRAAKTLRNLMFNIPARIVRTGRRLILRPPAGFRHSDIVKATLEAIYALGP